MEKIARFPVGHLSIKAEREQLIHARFVEFDGKSAQGDIKGRLARAGTARPLAVMQYDTADPKAEPAPDANDSTLRADGVRSKSIAFVMAAGEIDADTEVACAAEGKIVDASGAVAASLKTGVVGENNAITWTALAAGAAGNGLSITLVDPGGNNKPLEVDVNGKEIVAKLATDAEGHITTTAALLEAAILAHDEASQLVATANTAGSSGAGKVKAVAKTNLAAGADVVPAVGRAYTEGEAGDYIEIEVY